MESTGCWVLVLVMATLREGDERRASWRVTSTVNGGVIGWGRNDEHELEKGDVEYLQMSEVNRRLPP